jgi:4-hydroxybenzoate polyprenyltransferase
MKSGQVVAINGTNALETETTSVNSAAWLRLVRPYQWAKNLLLLAALIFSHHLFNLRDDLLAVAGAAAFCALASFAYVLNDIVDREADRLNPEKRDRPLASGEVCVGNAIRFALVLAAIGVGISLVLGAAFFMIATVYLALQFAYSLWAKRIVILDVIAVSAGFVIRAFAGGIAIGVDVTPWLVFITFSLALFLALARRRHELTILGGGAAAHRGALAHYNVRLIDQMLAILAGTTLVGYMIYTASAEIEAKLGSRYHHYAVLTVPFVAFGILRYLYLIDQQNEGGDPTRLLFKDRSLLLCMTLWIVTELFLVYL